MTDPSLPAHPTTQAISTAPTVALALGSGGARGYAHIGVIQELLARGYRIQAIAGSSMGSLVGGIHAAGHLDSFHDWARGLTRYQVWQLVDLTLSGGGFIKGDRIIGVLREMVGNLDIEDLPLRFTAVAADLDAAREVWFSKGPLFDAIRASIAIPSIFRPVHYRGHLLVDGGLLNPVPVTPLFGERADLLIAVDVNAHIGGSRAPEAAEQAPPAHDEADAANPPPEAAGNGQGTGVIDGYRQRIGAFVEGLFGRGARQGNGSDGPRALDLFARSLDTVQATLTRYKLAAQPPDVVIGVPRSACTFYEFDQAERLIELGRVQTCAALDAWQGGAGS